MFSISRKMSHVKNNKNTVLHWSGSLNNSNLTTMRKKKKTSSQKGSSSYNIKYPRKEFSNTGPHNYMKS